MDWLPAICSLCLAEPAITVSLIVDVASRSLLGVSKL